MLNVSISSPEAVLVEVSLDDVVGAGGDVERAIERIAASSGYGIYDSESDDMPVDEYVIEDIMNSIAAYGIQPSQRCVVNMADGRVAVGVDEFDQNGEWIGKIVWSEESKICFIAPTVQEILIDRKRFIAAATMARVVFEGGHSESIARDWWAIEDTINNLAKWIPEATDALRIQDEEIDEV